MNVPVCVRVGGYQCLSVCLLLSVSECLCRYVYVKVHMDMQLDVVVCARVCVFMHVRVYIEGDRLHVSFQTRLCACVSMSTCI